VGGRFFCACFARFKASLMRLIDQLRFPSSSRMARPTARQLMRSVCCT
jgi:hypothetical protein